ncbi:histidine phosphatase family protein [Halioglobus maricola]|uniref:histidine phosphatase family protein n=1 Tax=Halioglobus maricola TaxID=2601894 RepID=UPI00197A8C10|nr:histidine phosphatase family protein [Halioglobus maricola]
MIAKLTLLRHAHAQRPEGRCIGQWEHPLSNRGFDEIRALAQGWAGPLPRHIISSDIGRARETANTLARLLGATEPLLDERLREISMGDWEGRAWDEIYAREAEEVDAWGDNWVSCGPPGGESAEQVALRMQAVVSDSAPGTLLISHRGALGILLCSRAGRPLTHALNYAFANAAPASLD